MAVPFKGAPVLERSSLVNEERAPLPSQREPLDLRERLPLNGKGGGTVQSDGLL
jgi:hypothetical protein